MRQVPTVIALLMILILGGCNDEDLLRIGGGGDGKPVKVSGSVPAATRATMIDDGDFIRAEWERGDKIYLFTLEEKKLHKYKATNWGPTTDFEPDSDADILSVPDGTRVYALNRTYGAVGGHTAELILEPVKASAIVQDGRLVFDFEYVAPMIKLEVDFTGLDVDLTGYFLLNFLIKGNGLRFNHEYVYGNMEPDEVEAVYNQLFGPKSSEIAHFNELGVFYDQYNKPVPENATAYFPVDELSAGEQLQIHVALGYYENDELHEARMLLSVIEIPQDLKAGNVYRIVLDKSKFFDHKEAQERERAALIAFYNATNGDQWIHNDNWCSDLPIWTWYGVEATSGYVERLWMWQNNLTGRLPEEIGDLQFLNELMVDNNYIGGRLPESLGHLKYLQNLYLGTNMYDDFGGKYNRFIGEIPRSYANLKLDNFHANNNLLEGEIDWMLNAWHGTDVDVRYNQFSGPIPDDYFEHGTGHFSDNNFSGSMPSSLIKILDRMKIESGVNWGDFIFKLCSISNNCFTGDIPMEIYNHEYFPGLMSFIIPQKEGYGFNPPSTPFKWYTHVVRCYDGSYVNLKEEYAKNKYTFIFLWDDYTTPQEMTFVAELYKKYKDRGFGVLAAGRNPKELEPWIQQAFDKGCPGIRLFPYGIWVPNWVQDDPDAGYYKHHIIYGPNDIEAGNKARYVIVDKNSNVVYFGLPGKATWPFAEENFYDMIDGFLQKNL